MSTNLDHAPQHYLIVSDLHLADIEDHADGWKAHKHSRFCFDDRFDALVQRFCDEGSPHERRTLVLNGDIIDFDLVSAIPDDPPWPVSRSERRRGMDATEAKSTWKMARVLEHHPLFIQTLARFIAKGHTVVYVIGNHDPELHFAGVQEEMLRRLRQATEAKGGQFRTEGFRIEPWFFYVPGQLYVEHGQQYDSYTSFRYVLHPIVSQCKPPQIALSMGNLSNRRLLTQMGFFNPHASDFILNVFRYLGHWLRHYAFTRRSLVMPWFFGSLATLWLLLRTKRQMLSKPPDNESLFEALSRRNGVPLSQLHDLERLKRRPISNRFYRVIRELWLDRVLLAAVMTGGTIALALVPIPLWIKLMVPLSSFPLLFLIYEWFAHGETIFSVEREIHRSARRIARLFPVSLVAFGHTHKPGVTPLSAGVSYVNTGTWAPVTRQGKPDKLAPGLRNALFVRFDGPQMHFRLECCDDPVLVATGEVRPAAAKVAVAES